MVATQKCTGMVILGENPRVVPECLQSVFTMYKILKITKA